MRSPFRHRFNLSWPLLVEVEQVLPRGASRAAVLLPPEIGPPEGMNWRDTGEMLTVGDEDYRRFEIPSIEKGGVQSLAFRPLPSSVDVSTLRLTRSDYWVDHDDTEVRVNADVQFHVGGGLQLVGSADEPLLHIELPEGAEFQGLSAGSSALGVVPGENGGLDLLGPLPPGSSAGTSSHSLRERLYQPSGFGDQFSPQ